MNREEHRINFLIERDGYESARETIMMYRKIYRQAVLNKEHYASYRQYREEFILSYLDFKQFLNAPVVKMVDTPE